MDVLHKITFRGNSLDILQNYWVSATNGRTLDLTLVWTADASSHQKCADACRESSSSSASPVSRAYVPQRSLAPNFDISVVAVWSKHVVAQLLQKRGERYIVTVVPPIVSGQSDRLEYLPATQD